ncbi:hypothetical protein Tco_1133633 [Tanacetum coccineum]
MAGEWLKFNNRDFSLDSRKDFKKRLVKIQRKEIERLKALDIKEFAALHEGIALQNLNQFCHISFRQGRHSRKEKVTLDDLFLLHSMDGGVSVDVPWHVAKFFTDKAEGYKKKSSIVVAQLIGRIARSFGLMAPGALRGVTLGPETSLLGVAKLVELGICKYDALRLALMRALGDIETGISRLAGDVDELTYVDGFLTWNTDHLSQLIAHHHIDHTRFDGTPYAYVPDIPDLGVQQGVNFMSSTPIYSTAPSPSPNPFGLFCDANAGPSTTRSQQDDMNED